MKLYRFLTGPDDASFCHKVTAALNKGWHLFGSPTYAYDKKAKTMRCGQAVVKDAFSRAENTGKGVIALNGKMVERLHLAQAEKLLAKAAAIGA